MHLGRDCVSHHAPGRGWCIPACTWTGGCVSQHAVGQGVCRQVHLNIMLKLHDGYCSGRYTSYWNALLFWLKHKVSCCIFGECSILVFFLTKFWVCLLEIVDSFSLETLIHQGKSDSLSCHLQYISTFWNKGINSCLSDYKLLWQMKAIFNFTQRYRICSTFHIYACVSTHWPYWIFKLKEKN